LLAAQNNLSFVSEVDLHYLVAESEHYCVFCLHPFLNVAVVIIGCSVLV